MLKKLSRILLLAVFALALDAAAASAMVQRIAVLPFENASPLTAHQEIYLQEMNAAADYVIMELDNTGRFEAVEREQLERTVEEIGLGMTGLIDQNTAAQAGKTLGAKYLFYGKITNVSVKDSGVGVVALDVLKRRVNVTLTGRIIEVETGRIIKAARGTGNSTTSSTALGFRYRDRYGRYHTNAPMHVGSTEVTSENVDNALYKAAGNLVDNLVAALEGRPVRRH